MKVYTKAEIIRLLIPYIGKKALYENFERQITVDLLINSILDGEESLKPYLKPLRASKFGDMSKALHRAFDELKHLPDDELRVMNMYAYALDILRWQGYDCDRLIDQGLALCDP